jgi:hypothetical protein
MKVSTQQINSLMIMKIGVIDTKQKGCGNLYALTLLKTVCFALINLTSFINDEFINKVSLLHTSPYGITDQKTNVEC